MNLLEETIDILKEQGITKDKVLWIGSSDGKLAISWNQFAELAKDIEYDEGFGGQEIANDLVVVGKGWWLDRFEYDGSERWEYNTAPKKSRKPKEFTTMSGGCWDSLEVLNDN